MVKENETAQHPFSGIVFVDQRRTATRLCQLIESHPQLIAAGVVPGVRACVWRACMHDAPVAVPIFDCLLCLAEMFHVVSNFTKEESIHTRVRTECLTPSFYTYTICGMHDVPVAERITDYLLCLAGMSRVRPNLAKEESIHTYVVYEPSVSPPSSNTHTTRCSWVTARL